MKKITFLLFSILMGTTAFAQDTCATAIPLNLTGNNVVTVVNGTQGTTLVCSGGTDQATAAEWYSYTATATGVLNLNSNLTANAGGDTRVQVYRGTCGALVCAGGSDDVSGSNYLTNVNVNVTAGTNYFIAWDDLWDPTGFTFTATFTAVSNPPSCATNPLPAIAATGVAINAANTNAVALSWSAPAGAPATTYEIRFGTSATAPTSLTTTFTGTSVNITNTLYDTQYYWQIIAANGAGSATGCAIWSFTTQAATGTPPTNATTPAPANGATAVAIDPADTDMNGTPDNSVNISWVQTATGQQPNAYTIRLGDSPSTLQTLTTTFTATAARFINQLAGTTYFWQAVPTNSGVEAANQPIWSYTTAGTASVDDEIMNFFTLSPNPTTDFISINTDLPIEKITIFNMLGQIIMANPIHDNNRINVSDLQSGLYLITVSNGNSEQTSRFIKN
jgi:hypothetical protein